MDDEFTVDIPFMQTDTVTRNGTYYPKEVVEKAMRDQEAKLSKERKQKSIKILKDIDNIEPNWEDNPEDDHWDELKDEA